MTKEVNNHYEPVTVTVEIVRGSPSVQLASAVQQVTSIIKRNYPDDVFTNEKVVNALEVVISDYRESY